MASIGDSSTKIRPLLGVGDTYSLQKNVDLRVDYDHVSGLGKSGQGGAMSDNMVSVGVAYNF
jgi:predicted porin